MYDCREHCSSAAQLCVVDEAESMLHVRAFIVVEFTPNSTNTLGIARLLLQD